MRSKLAKRILVCVLILMFMGAPADASAQTYTTEEEVCQVIKDNLLAHKAEFSIEMDKKIMDTIGLDNEVLDTVFALDDKNTSQDADYLKFSVNQWSEGWKYSTLGNTATLTFNVEYDSTLKQENKLNDKIKSALEKLNLTDKTDYEKVKAIHDYIINRVSYDQTLGNHSAYSALIKKSSVCEGYSAAAYRMFTDAGIDCRIITGWSGGDPHSWNIVKVDGQWYNIDLTWDDPITNTGKQILSYQYFLKSNQDFENHNRDAAYNTKTFLNQYPIALKSYTLS